MKQKTNYKIVIAGMFCITALELGALYQGINGLVLTTVIAAIAGMAGWSMPQLKVK